MFSHVLFDLYAAKVRLYFYMSNKGVVFIPIYLDSNKKELLCPMAARQSNSFVLVGSLW